MIITRKDRIQTKWRWWWWWWSIYIGHSMDKCHHTHTHTNTKTNKINGQTKYQQNIEWLKQFNLSNWFTNRKISMLKMSCDQWCLIFFSLYCFTHSIMIIYKKKIENMKQQQQQKKDKFEWFYYLSILLWWWGQKLKTFL